MHKPSSMNRLTLGVICSIAFWLTDVAITVFGQSSGREWIKLLQAFSSRLSIGFVSTN